MMADIRNPAGRDEQIPRVFRNKSGLCPRFSRAGAVFRNKSGLALSLGAVAAGVRNGRGCGRRPPPSPQPYRRDGPVRHFGHALPDDILGDTAMPTLVCPGCCQPLAVQPAAVESLVLCPKCRRKLRIRPTARAATTPPPAVLTAPVRGAAVPSPEPRFPPLGGAESQPTFAPRRRRSMVPFVAAGLVVGLGLGFVVGA